MRFSGLWRKVRTKKKGCHFVVIPRLKQPKNNPNNDSLLLANYLILNNSVVETAGIDPAALEVHFGPFQGYLFGSAQAGSECKLQ